MRDRPAQQEQVRGLLDDPTPPAPETRRAADLNNLRRINNSMGHEAGDAYIRRFAVALRAAMPEKHFVGPYRRR